MNLVQETWERFWYMTDVVQLLWWKPCEELIFFLSPLLCSENPSLCIISLELQRSKAECQKTQKASLVPAHPSCNSMDLDEIIPGVNWAQWSSLSLLDFMRFSMRICNAKLSVKAKELCKWSEGVRKWGGGGRKKKWRGEIKLVLDDCQLWLYTCSLYFLWFYLVFFLQFFY